MTLAKDLEILLRRPARRRKYGNDPTGLYASKKEAKRAQELALLQKARLIRGLQSQVRFELVPKQDEEQGVDYVADFVYYEGGMFVVEDVKSAATRKNRAYVIKRKLMRYLHNIRIRET